MYCGHARLYVCMCVSVRLSAAACPHYCTDPDVIWRSGRGCPQVVRYWADLQSVHGLRCRDGRPAEYRWRPLFNAAKFGWRPLLECCAVTLSRRETRWNLQGCPKLANRSQPFVGRSSPYYQDMWRRYCCLWSPYVIGQTIIFSSCGYFYLLLLLFFLA